MTGSDRVMAASGVGNERVILITRQEYVRIDEERYITAKPAWLKTMK
jgi:hypothetical protein